MKKHFIILTTLLLVLAAPVFVSGSTGYTVQQGDTLSGIARQHGVSVQELIDINPNIDNPDLIHTGDIVHIPGGSDRIKQEEQSGQEQWSGNDPSIYSITEAEKNLLAKLIHAEAKGESYAGKLAVAHVILNRVEDDRFPDTITEVIQQPGQFQPVTNGAIHQKPDKESMRVVQEALSNREQNNGSLYFYNPDTSTDTWIFSRDTVEVIGNHVFAK